MTSTSAAAAPEDSASEGAPAPRAASRAQHPPPYITLDGPFEMALPAGVDAAGLTLVLVSALDVMSSGHAPERKGAALARVLESDMAAHFVEQASAPKESAEAALAQLRVKVVRAGASRATLSVSRAATGAAENSPRAVYAALAHEGAKFRSLPFAVCPGGEVRPKIKGELAFRMGGTEVFPKHGVAFCKDFGGKGRRLSASLAPAPDACTVVLADADRADLLEAVDIEEPAGRVTFRLKAIGKNFVFVGKRAGFKPFVSEAFAVITKHPIERNRAKRALATTARRSAASAGTGAAAGSGSGARGARAAALRRCAWPEDSSSAASEYGDTALVDGDSDAEAAATAAAVAAARSPRPVHAAAAAAAEAARRCVLPDSDAESLGNGGGSGASASASASASGGDDGHFYDAGSDASSASGGGDAKRRRFGGGARASSAAVPALRGQVAALRAELDAERKRSAELESRLAAVQIVAQHEQQLAQQTQGARAAAPPLAMPPPADALARHESFAALAASLLQSSFPATSMLHASLGVPSQCALLQHVLSAPPSQAQQLQQASLALDSLGLSGVGVEEVMPAALTLSVSATLAL